MFRRLRLLLADYRYGRHLRLNLGHCGHIICRDRKVIYVGCHTCGRRFYAAGYTEAERLYGVAQGDQFLEAQRQAFMALRGER